MRAGDIMTTGAATVRPDASIVEAARMMVEHRISGLPVVDGQGKLVGIVTEGDFLRTDDGGRPRIIEVATGGMSAGELMIRRVEEIMSRDPITAGVETSLEEVVALMEQHSVKRLPIVTEGKVVGILSRANLIMALVRKAWSHDATRP
jgi:CBS domain-containing protein